MYITAGGGPKTDTNSCKQTPKLISLHVQVFFCKFVFVFQSFTFFFPILTLVCAGTYYPTVDCCRFFTLFVNLHHCIALFGVNMSISIYSIYLSSLVHTQYLSHWSGSGKVPDSLGQVKLAADLPASSSNNSCQHGRHII